MTDAPPPASATEPPKDATGAPAASSAAPVDVARIHELSVIIRPWPKVIYLYPTLVAALICWLILFFSGDPFDLAGKNAVAASDAAKAAASAAAAGTTEADPAVVTAERSSVGNFFMLVFFLNLLVFSFDFSRIKSITIAIAAVGIAFGIAWADTRWEVTGGIMNALDGIDIQMNAQFYGWMALFLSVSLVMVLINTRFNYYEINHREILHHHGYLGDITRVPTQGLRFNKEIYDLMEFALMRSGRLIFITPTSHEAIVIDNVPGVNKVEALLKDLLSVVAVRMQ